MGQQSLISYAFYLLNQMYFVISQVTFIYTVLFTIQIVSKQL